MARVGKPRPSANGHNPPFAKHKKTRHRGGSLLTVELDQAFLFRLINPIPANPIPKRAKVPGSGTETSRLV